MFLLLLVVGVMRRAFGVTDTAHNFSQAVSKIEAYLKPARAKQFIYTVRLRDGSLSSVLFVRS